MNNHELKALYVESLSLHSLFCYVVPVLFRSILKKYKVQIFICTRPNTIKCIVLNLFDRNYSILDLNSIEIDNDNGECINSIITGKDRLNFIDKIINTRPLLKLINDNKKINNFYHYFIKSIVGGSNPIEYRNTKALNYNLKLIRRVHEHSKLLGIKNYALVLLNRPWFKYFKEYGL